jgi:hypothetical protein
VEIPARREDEERTPHRCVPLVLCQWDGLSGDVRQDDQIDVTTRQFRRCIRPPRRGPRRGSRCPPRSPRA